MKGGLECIKYLVLFGNLIIFFLGGALIGLGVYAQIKGEGDKMITFSQCSIPLGLIILGAFVMLVAFFGCCGAARESRFCLGFFFFLLLLITAAEVGLSAGTYFLYRNKIPSVVREAWTHSDNETRAFVQNHFNCCGLMNVTDAPEYPCPGNYSGQGNTTLEGCEAKLKEDLHSKVVIVAATAAAVAVIQLLALIFSGTLCCRIPSEDEQRRALLKESYVVNRNYDTTQPRNLYP